MLVVMIGEEEMSRQRRDGADGNQTDLRRETVAEKDNESVVRLPPKKLRDSSIINGAGKIVRGVRKANNKIL